MWIQDSFMFQYAELKWYTLKTVCIMFERPNSRKGGTTMAHHFPCKIVYCLFVYVGEQFNDDGEYPV